MHVEEEEEEEEECKFCCPDGDLSRTFWLEIMCCGCSCLCIAGAFHATDAGFHLQDRVRRGTPVPDAIAPRQPIRARFRRHQRRRDAALHRPAVASQAAAGDRVGSATRQEREACQRVHLQGYLHAPIRASCTPAAVRRRPWSWQPQQIS